MTSPDASGSEGRGLSTVQDTPRFSIAPGSVVIVRDEEWLVTGVEHTADGRLLRCRSLSELVRASATGPRANARIVVPIRQLSDEPLVVTVILLEPARDHQRRDPCRA